MACHGRLAHALTPSERPLDIGELDIDEPQDGLRKIRFRIGNREKSGGGHAICYLAVSDDMATVIAAYAKAEKEELSPDDRKAVLRILKEREK